MADTGSGHDLIGKQDTPNWKDLARFADFILKVIDAKSEVLGTVVCPRLLGETPAVLSVGRRCIDDGWTFVWPGHGNPYFKKPDGKRIERQVDN